MSRAGKSDIQEKVSPVCARRFAAAGLIEITQQGCVVDPVTARGRTRLHRKLD